MLDKFYYVNNDGEKVIFGENGLFANYNDLRDYEWSFSDDNRIVSGFYKDVSSKSIPAVIVKNSLSERIEARNRIFEAVEKDVLSGKKGKIYIGEWYLNCWITAIENSNYLRHADFSKIELTVTTDDPFWYRNEMFSFSAISGTATGGIEFPFDFTFDLQQSKLGQNNIDNSEPFPAAFQITAYGPCSENVSIKIGGHTYQVNVGLNAGENLVIDSKNKTITKVLQDRSEISAMRYRYKKESVFESIQPGNNELTWNGNFGFDILLLHRRSEPDWISLTSGMHEKDEPPSGGGTSEDLSMYLLDSNSELILDSNGERIEL